MEYIEGKGLRLDQKVKSPEPGEAFPAKERSHVFRVEAAPVEKKIYETKEGVPIEISCRAFFPVGSFSPKEGSVSAEYKEGEGISLHEGVKNPNLKKEGESGEGFVVLPGVGLEAEGRTAEDFGEAFARSSKETTYVITTKVMQQIENSTYEEASAISKFLEEKGIKNATIAGNSMGGHKAIDLISILQKEEKVAVNGLALLSSVGLRETSPERLGKEFFMNDPARAAFDLVGPESKEKRRQHKNKIESGIRAASLAAEVSGGIAKYIAEATKNAPDLMSRAKTAWSRVTAELRAAAKANPRMKEIECPVVLISGDQDIVSGLNELTESGLDKRAREDYFKREVFPKSPAVKVITPQEIPGHGVSILRVQEVARVAVHSIGMMRKAQEIADLGSLSNKEV